MNAPDPLIANAMTNPQRWNLYAYVGNNPLTFNDPSGMDATAVVAGQGMRMPLPGKPLPFFSSEFARAQSLSAPSDLREHMASATSIISKPRQSPSRQIRRPCSSSSLDLPPRTVIWTVGSVSTTF